MCESRWYYYLFIYFPFPWWGAPCHYASFLCFICLFFCSSGTHIYSHQDLIRTGFQAKIEITGTFALTHSIPPEIARPPGTPWTVIRSSKCWRQRRERRQKRGCRAGLLNQLRNQPHRPPLPSVFLTNARSRANKIDELQSQIAYNCHIHDCCLLIVRESWLRPHIPNATVALAGRTFPLCDRTKASGKRMGRGLCVYVLEDWCSDSRVIDTHCSPEVQKFCLHQPI